MDIGATPCGVIGAVALLAVGAFLHRALSRSGPTSMIVGSVAHVAVRIPEHGVGLIALVVGSRRTTLPARCADGGGIPRSTEVVVVDMRARVALVSPID
jgi:hypothetical protein